MQGVTEGRIVHYVLKDGRGAGQHRPAIIVKVWGGQDPPLVQLQVFTDSDGENNDGLPPVMWKTSVAFNEAAAAGTWHWIEPA